MLRTLLGVLALALLLVAAAASPPVSNAAFPGTNGKIAFHSNMDGDWEIYVINADGTGQTRLTNSPGWDGGGAWSRDGTRIAFSSTRDGNSEIYVMNADGTGQTRLTTNPASDASPVSWSPDGQKIAFQSSRDGKDEIYVMNADGTGQTRLTSNGGWAPAWSPDGTKIAFASNRDGNWDIYLMSSDGTGQTNCSDSSAEEFEADWSPDGTKIAFSTFAHELFVVNADCTGAANLTAQGDRMPKWSPDGTKITFASSRDGSWTVHVMNVDGTGQTRLTNNSVQEPEQEWPTGWQPLDVTPPTITIATPPEGATYTLGQVVLADYSCADQTGGSGVASCVGAVPDGSPIDTASIGSKTFTVTASDNAGNPAALTYTYAVVYDFTGFFWPVENFPAVNTWRAGLPIPVRFGLAGHQGRAIFAPGYPKSEQIACGSSEEVDGAESTMPAGARGLVYNPLTRHYIYVWLTKSAWKNTCRQLVVKLADDTSHRANFKFK